MQRLIGIFFISFFLFHSNTLKSQVDENQLGAWYMYFWNTSFNDSQFGLQGDVQYRNWDVLGDLEQLLLRGGLTYQPENTKFLFTFGYANITTGAYGSSDATVNESRIYQEALLPQRLASHIYLTHRFRFEQRFLAGQDTRTRWRYNLFINIPLNKTTLDEGAVYIALYNELFINGQREIGNGRSVELFDRNRTYVGLGIGLKDNLRTQLGFMQQTTDNWSKGQLQFSLHHSF